MGTGYISTHYQSAFHTLHKFTKPGIKLSKLKKKKITISAVLLISHSHQKKQAGAELGQAQLRLELGFTLIEICCIKLITRLD